jgi:phage shock protein PspC (stress-responsive transcriptional regulator)
MTNLFTRPDTFFGVCEALGEDLGVNPIWLRIALGVGVLWQPLAVIASYLALGALVLALRLLMPNAKGGEAASEPMSDAANDAETPVLATAA